MQHPEIDLRTLAQEQAETSSCGDKLHEGQASARPEHWIEEYAATGATKGDDV